MGSKLSKSKVTVLTLYTFTLFNSYIINKHRIVWMDIWKFCLSLYKEYYADCWMKYVVTVQVGNRQSPHWFSVILHDYQSGLSWYTFSMFSKIQKNVCFSFTYLIMNGLAHLTSFNKRMPPGMVTQVRQGKLVFFY